MPIRQRSDGVLVANVHPVRRIMPFVMPTRTEAFVLFEQQIEIDAAQRFLAAANSNRPPEREITLFHLVLRALGLALHEFPRLNRFVSGNRLYERRGIWLAFSAKKRLERDAPIFTAKVPFDPAETIHDLADRLHALVDTTRQAGETPTEREVRPFLRVPAPMLRIGTRAFRWLDARNLLPAAFIAQDPLYASVFVANLGSVGLQAAYHHLFEYGTIPIFVTIGRIGPTAIALDDGRIVARETMTLRYTYDERTEDGFYAARALERVAAYLTDPA